MKRKWKKKDYKKNVLAGTCLILMTACTLLTGMVRKDSLMNSVIRQGVSEGYFGMLKTAVPSIFYSGKTPSLEKVWWEQIFNVIPVYGYITKAEEYTTQMESDISYETIIAREARDENYIDQETGEVVTGGEEEKAEEVPDQEEEGAKEQKDKEEGAPAKNPGEDNARKEEDAKGQEETGETAEASVNAGGFTPNNEPVASYPMEKLKDFDYLLQNFYVVDRTTTINSSQLNVEDLLGRNMRLTHGADTPQILIYHTHSQERFADSTEDPSTSIVGAGEYLTKLLGEYGFHVIHHKGEYDVESRDNAYSRAGPAVEQILKENPGIEIVIDLHRDGVPEGTHLVTEQGGKQMASIMFFNGLSRTTANGDISYLPNPYIQDNLAFSLQMQLAAKQYYPGFSRAIYLKGYRYNMHYCPRTLLVEVGAQTNTVQEIMNAMEPLADILAKVISPAQ